MQFWVYSPTSSEIDVNNVRWENDHEIRFEWSSGCGSEFIIQATLFSTWVNAVKDNNQPVPKLLLDGGSPNYYGVAPNEDDFVWAFWRGV